MDQPTAHVHSPLNEARSGDVPSGTVPSKTISVSHFALAITAVFFVIAIIGIVNHEMWRDEFHCWLIARDAHSLAQLYRNTRYDGHPILWYLLLYILTCFTAKPAAMQILVLVLATTGTYLF